MQQLPNKAWATMYLCTVAHKLQTTEPCETKVMYAGKLQSSLKTLMCHLRVNFHCIHVQWVHCNPPLVYTPLPEEEVSNMSFRFHYWSETWVSSFAASFTGKEKAIFLLRGCIYIAGLQPILLQISANGMYSFQEGKQWRAYGFWKWK